MSVPTLPSAQQGYRRGPSLLFAGRNLKGLSLALGQQSSRSQSSSSPDTDASFSHSLPCLPQFLGLVHQSRTHESERPQNSPRPPHLQVAIPEMSSTPRLLQNPPHTRLSNPCPYTPAVSKTPFLPPPLCTDFDPQTPSDRTISTPLACTIFTQRSGSETTPLSEDLHIRSGLPSEKHSPEPHDHRTSDKVGHKHRNSSAPGKHSPRQYSLRSAIPESPQLRFPAPLIKSVLGRDSPRRALRLSPKSPRLPMTTSTIIAAQGLDLRCSLPAPKLFSSHHHSPPPDEPSWHNCRPSSIEYQTNPIDEKILPDSAYTSQITTLYKNSAAPEELREANTLPAYPRGPRNVLDNLVFLYSDPDPTKNVGSCPVDIANYDLVINVAEECNDLTHLFPTQVPGKKQYVHFQWSHTSAIAPDLPEIVQLLHSFYRRGKRALIHCQCGVLRLACVIVAFYMQHFSMGVNEAYERLKQGSDNGDACDRICPNMSLIFELMEFGDYLKQSAGIENNNISNVATVVESQKPKHEFKSSTVKHRSAHS